MNLKSRKSSSARCLAPAAPASPWRQASSSREVSQYKRGCLHILDRQRLEGAACEWYPVIRSLSEVQLATRNESFPTTS